MILSAYALLTGSDEPLIAISTGVGEPKLITRDTMSCGSNENRTSGSSRANTPRSFSLNASMRIPVPGLNCTASQPSSGPPFQRCTRFTGKLELCTPTMPIVTSTLSAPPASRLMISSTRFASASVRSTRVPLGARNRTANWPLSVRGKISVPSRPPIVQITPPQTAR